MPKKKIKEQEIRVPNQDSNPRSDAFNRELFNYLQTSNWTSPDVQKNLVAIINSIILTGSKNTNAQSMIVDYLKRGLDVLDVEIQRLEVDPSQRKVIEVDPDEVDDPSQVQEMKRKRKDILKKIHENIDKFKNNKTLLKETKLFVEACKKLDEQEGEQEGEKEQEKTDQEKTDQEKNDEPVDTESKEMYLNNYRTFMNNYLGHDKGWNDKNISSITSLIERIVVNFSSSSRKQSLVNIEVRNLHQVFQKVSGQDPDFSFPSNAISAQNELVNYAQIHGGWGSETIGTLLTNIFSMIESTKNKTHVNVIIKKLNEIYNNIG